MEGGMVFEGSNLPVFLHNDSLPSSDVLDPFWVSNPSSSFHGSTSMVNFESSQGEPNNMITQFFNPLDSEENVDEDYDKCSYQPEKKRRLTVAQVQFLETSFEVENKLEPDRKIQLAKELNLQPRQVAIWFQNRRARYKTKQLERDYDLLKASYDKLKVGYGSLNQENEKLKQEVNWLMEKFVQREEGKIGSKQCGMINSKDMEPSKPISIANSVNVEPNVAWKIEDANSAKSDVFDSEGDSCHVFEREHSDFEEEDENLGRSLLRPPRFPKLEEGSYIDASDNSCNLGYAVEDHQSFWFWA